VRIAIIGSYARDLIEADGEIAERTGGPAYFLTAVLDHLDVAYDVYAGTTPATVRITMRDGREVGTVESCASIVVPERIEADACIVSTILDEFSVERLGGLPGYLALDVQGYVRRPGGGRGPWSPPTDVWESLTCVKTADEELPFLPETLLASQRRRTLIVTRGVSGATVWDHGTAYEIPATPIAAPHALGAGDIFLTAFVVARLRGMDVLSAGRFAARMVYDFLRGGRFVPKQEGGSP